MEQTKTDRVTEKFLAILCTHLRFVEDAQTIPRDAVLEDLGLDSMGAVNLLLDLEDTFEIAFPDSMLTEETFRTAASLCDAVRLLTNNRG